MQELPFGHGQLVAVMRWHALIEHPAKGKAVIGRRGEQGSTGADREVACMCTLCILCVRSTKSLKVSPCLPFAPRRGEAGRQKLQCPPAQHKHITFPCLAREAVPSSLHPHLSSWLLFLQQAQMAAQMVIWGLSISLG